MSFDAALSLFSPRFRAGGCGCGGCPGCGGAEVGAVERRNPLPPARYWVDVFESDLAAFQAWLAANPAVRVVANEEHPDESPKRTWYLFDVAKSPAVTWQGPGLPSVADTNVTSSSDTAQRPDKPPSLANQLESALTGPVSTFTTVMIGALAVGVVLAVSKAGGR